MSCPGEVKTCQFSMVWRCIYFTTEQQIGVEVTSLSAIWRGETCAGYR